MGIFHISELPEAQKACLRLIFQGYEVKEVGLRLKLSHYTITERLRAARRLTNTQNSMETARLLAAHEGLIRNIQDVNRLTVIPLDPDPALMMSLSIKQNESAGNKYEDISIREDQMSYSTAVVSRGWKFPLPFPREGIRQNDLNAIQTLSVIVALTLGLGFAAIAAIAVVDELSRLVIK